MAKYLGKSYFDWQIDQIVNWCSFDNMKRNPSTNKEYIQDMGYFVKQGHFYRQGKIGDWRNHFSEKQLAEFDILISENLKYEYKFNYG